ncbi:MAG: TlpA family protein disulfide reductase, partial [Bacteroidetes bacterium]|nr:TlpA family protein disulfide reductase [Bacteroidota bacterium]
LKQDLPNSSYVADFAKGVDQMRGTTIGQLAPDIVLPNPQGETKKLSELRGNIVMIDFWAAWCGPCRRENPNVVRLYNKYHDKGFEIYGVSLDRSKDDWIKAIEKDGLTWTQVSDLSYFNSEAAQTYGITSIPATVLLDKEGKIIARNLRGQALEDKLEEIFGNTSAK